MPKFGNTAFDNPVADNLTFRDQDGSPVKYNTGALPETTPYWSPRVGINWDVNGNQATQVRGGSGLFSGKPPYVWISNQIGNTGVLYGFIDTPRHDRVPVQPEPGQVQAGGDRRHGGQLRARRDRQGFRFPQTWRTNIGVDRRLPWGLVGSLDYIYNQDINAPVYINANLPAPTGAYTGVDNRNRWAATAAGHGAGARHHRRAAGVCDELGQDRARAAAPQQRARQSDHRELRDQEPEPEPLAEHLRRASPRT